MECGKISEDQQPANDQTILQQLNDNKIPRELSTLISSWDESTEPSWHDTDSKSQMLKEMEKDGVDVKKLSIDDVKTFFLSDERLASKLITKDVLCQPVVCDNENVKSSASQSGSVISIIPGDCVMKEGSHLNDKESISESCEGSVQGKETIGSTGSFENISNESQISKDSDKSEQQHNGTFLDTKIVDGTNSSIHSINSQISKSKVPSKNGKEDIVYHINTNTDEKSIDTLKCSYENGASVVEGDEMLSCRSCATSDEEKDLTFETVEEFSTATEDSVENHIVTNSSSTTDLSTHYDCIVGEEVQPTPLQASSIAQCEGMMEMMHVQNDIICNSRQTEKKAVHSRQTSSSTLSSFSGVISCEEQKKLESTSVQMINSDSLQRNQNHSGVNICRKERKNSPVFVGDFKKNACASTVLKPLKLIKSNSFSSNPSSRIWSSKKTKLSTSFTTMHTLRNSKHVVHDRKIDTTKHNKSQECTVRDHRREDMSEKTPTTLKQSLTNGIKNEKKKSSQSVKPTFIRQQNIYQKKCVIDSKSKIGRPSTKSGVMTLGLTSQKHQHITEKKIVTIEIKNHSSKQRIEHTSKGSGIKEKTKSKKKEEKPKKHLAKFFSKPSKIVKRAGLNVDQSADGDIWVEKIFQSKKTGKRRIYFCSSKTGRKVRDEPPTGASKVIYRDTLPASRSKLVPATITVPTNTK